MIPKLKQAITNRQVLWMHAVSVGEVNICTQLIRALEPRVPNLKFVVSTTTTTGMGELQKTTDAYQQDLLSNRSAILCHARARNHPAEGDRSGRSGDLAQFPLACARSGVPLFLVNARLSERSFRGYRRCGFCSGPVSQASPAVGTQNEADAARLRELGCRPEAIHVVGSLEIRRGPAGRETGSGCSSDAASKWVFRRTPCCWWVAARMPAKKRLLAEQFPPLARAFSRICF